MKDGINVRHITWFTFACILVFIPGLFVDVMNIDAGQYAAIARDMAESGNWLQVQNHGADYLDKPPLLFWLSAASFKIFGVSNFAYKLPSFLFAILGIYATRKLAELLYDKTTGAIAGLMLAFSLGMFVMTNDIRTDTILLGASVFATWQLLLFIKTKRWINLILGFSGIGFAMLAKGPLGIVLPVAALSCEFAYKRQWKNFFRWQWLVGLVIVGLLLLPMCYGLYQQFDLHPEKTINGQTGVSGLKFYFWTQSFGRITGESDWGTKFDNGAGPFFFTHTFMWVFFPWSLFLVGGLLKNLIVLVKSKFRSGYLIEVLSTGGFVLMFLALSASRYKLPHYVYVLLPFAAIIASRFLIHDVLNPAKKMLLRIFSVFHYLFFVALTFVSSLLLFIVFSDASFLTSTFAIIWMIAGILFAWKLHEPFARLIFPLLAGLLCFYFVGDSHFYPALLKYQSGNTIGRIVIEKKIPPGAFVNLNVVDPALDFYYDRPAPTYDWNDSLVIDSNCRKFGRLWLYADEETADRVKTSSYKIKTEMKFEDFSVQFLSFNFLNPKTREKVLRNRYLLEITK